jgi:hypothetical protein
MQHNGQSISASYLVIAVSEKTGGLETESDIARRRGMRESYHIL